MTYHVLWVEDSPQGAFAPYLSPILSDPDIDLEVAYDATQAFQRLKSKYYDLIIFDLDLPAGDNDALHAIYRFCVPSAEVMNCVLGCHLLRLWLGHEPDNLPEEIETKTLRLPRPLSIQQIIVYSVYANNFRENLKNLGLKKTQIIQKDAKQGRFFLHRRVKSFLEGK